MASILPNLLKLFRRKKPAPLACTVNLDASGEPITNTPAPASSTSSPWLSSSSSNLRAVKPVPPLYLVFSTQP